MTKENAHDLAKSFGYLTLREVDALKTLAKMLPPKPTVLNIGAGAGTSSVAFLETRNDLILHTVDIRQDSPLGSLQSELNAIEKAELDVRGRHFQYLGDSKQICLGLPKSLFDLAFIDGDHEKAGIEGDITVVLPLLKDGAIIAFDDYGPNKNGIEIWSDVRVTVDQMIAIDYELILHEDSVIAFRVMK